MDWKISFDAEAWASVTRRFRNFDELVIFMLKKRSNACHNSVQMTTASHSELRLCCSCGYAWFVVGIVHRLLLRLRIVQTDKDKKLCDYSLTIIELETKARKTQFRATIWYGKLIISKYLRKKKLTVKMKLTVGDGATCGHMSKYSEAIRSPFTL